MDTIVFGPLHLERVDYCTARHEFVCNDCARRIPAETRYARVCNPGGTWFLCPPCAASLEADACTPS
jgi:hypothetical protein